MHMTATRAVFLSLLAIVLSFEAGATTLAERVAGLAAPPDGQLNYSETRSSGLLSRPVVYTGRLTFDPESGALSKWVEEPRRARLTLNDTRLEAQSGDGRVRSLPTERQPELAAMLAGLRALLSGDAEALQDIFQADYLEGKAQDGRDTEWVLQLRPLDTELAGRLVMLELRGSNDRLTQIDSLMASGDRQSMVILPPAEAETSDTEPDGTDQDDGP